MDPVEQDAGGDVVFRPSRIDPAKDKTFRANFTVRKVSDNLWGMWVGTTGYSWEVDRAGLVELEPSRHSR